MGPRGHVGFPAVFVPFPRVMMAGCPTVYYVHAVCQSSEYGEGCRLPRSDSVTWGEGGERDGAMGVHSAGRGLSR